MKRLWLGVVILAVLLTGGTVVTCSMNATHSQISHTLQQAADTAMAGDLNKAVELAADAKQQWERHWRFTAAFADHTPMDELDSLFAEMEIFAEARDMPHFAVCCASLAKAAQAMADSHNLSWWNLL